MQDDEQYDEMDDPQEEEEELVDDDGEEEEEDEEDDGAHSRLAHALGRPLISATRIGLPCAVHQQCNCT